MTTEGPSPDPQNTPSDEVAARLLGDALTQDAVLPGTPPSMEAVQAAFPELLLESLVGEGGMGYVFRARQRTLDRLVALKLLRAELSDDPAFSERFLREARALARLDHSGIVRVHDFGERAGFHFLLMEYVDGASLRSLMEAGTMAPEEALAIVPQICDALQYAHDLGVVHRDIKPSNILMDARGRVKLADFGLAKLSEGAVPFATLTTTNQLMGTVQYMAPEQIKAPGEVDHRADIFSLGVVFYEMLTGDLPVGRVRPPSASQNVDARIDAIVMRTLERERAARFQRASSVGDAVTRVGTAGVGGRAVVEAPGASQAGGTGVRARLRGWRSWPWHLIPVAVFVLAALGAAGTFGYRVLTHPHRAWSNTAGHVLSAGFVGLCLTVLSCVPALLAGPQRTRIIAMVVWILALVTAAGGAVGVVQWHRSMQDRYEHTQPIPPSLAPDDPGSSRD